MDALDKLKKLFDVELCVETRRDIGRETLIENRLEERFAEIWTVFNFSVETRVVVFKGRSFNVTAGQMLIVKGLWDHFRMGRPFLSQEVIMNELFKTPDSLVKDVFRGSGLWKQLIVSPKKGFFGLNIPQIEYHLQPVTVEEYCVNRDTWVPTFRDVLRMPFIGSDCLCCVPIVDDIESP